MLLVLKDKGGGGEGATEVGGGVNGQLRRRGVGETPIKIT